MREGDFTLSADGGGSKLAAVMFDDAFHFRAAGYGGPVNGSFSETEKRRQIAAALSPCLSSVPSGGIGRAFLSAPWTGSREEEEDNNLFFLEVKKHSPRVRCSPLSEGEACLLAGSFRREGTVTLSGTGSGVFQVGPRQRIWGDGDIYWEISEAAFPSDKKGCRQPSGGKNDGERKPVWKNWPVRPME